MALNLRTCWRQVLVILWPVLLCPLVFPYSERSSESKCMFIVLVAAFFWITELLPLPVTSLLPLAFCPLLGIKSSKEASKFFFNDVSLLLIGGLTMAIALEKCELHRRVALLVLSKIGLQPRRLMFGVMSITAFLSMWINNTAATGMMISITKALLERVYKDEIESNKENESKTKSAKNINGGTEDTGNGIEKAPVIEYNEIDSLMPARDEESGSHDADIEPPSDAVLTFGIPYQAEQKEAHDLQTSQDVSSRRENRKYYIKGETIELRNWRQLPSEADNIEELEGKDEKSDKDLFDRMNEEDNDTASDRIPPGPSFRRSLRVFSMCIAYSANIGGTATLIGSPPNLILSQTIHTMSGQPEINYVQWLVFGLPVCLITLLLCFVWMNIFLYGVRSTLACKTLRSQRQVEFAARKVREELHEMGDIKYSEKVVLVHFIVLVSLWLTRNPGFSPGWAALFPHNYISDGAVAVAISLSLFVFSNERPNVFFFRAKGDARPPRSMPSVLTWKLVRQHLPWGVLLLLGGAFVLADAVKVSGLSQTAVSYMLVMKDAPKWLVCLAVIASTCVCTELASNSVIAILILPLLKDVAAVMQVHPLYLMFPATVAASMAFMLPVATPPNSIVYGVGHVTIPDMVKAGWVLNVIGAGVIFLAAHTWGWEFFQLGSVPEWGRLALHTATGYNSSSSADTSWPVVEMGVVATVTNGSYNASL